LDQKLHNQTVVPPISEWRGPFDSNLFQIEFVHPYYERGAIFGNFTALERLHPLSPTTGEKLTWNEILPGSILRIKAIHLLLSFNSRPKSICMSTPQKPELSKQDGYSKPNKSSFSNLTPLNYKNSLLNLQELKERTLLLRKILIC
jgi:hypothetical protein